MSNGIGDKEQLACAKLTLHLHVGAVRPDGFHMIDAEMVSLELADVLEFGKGDGVEIVNDGYADVIPSGPENLITKALRSVGASAHVRLTKNIPVGGGLGGGSSDAAAALRWAGVLDPEAAAHIGADVPFCLRGGRARVGGIGEIIEALPYKEQTFTLLVPPFGVNTSQVYRTFDLLLDKGIKPGAEANHLEAAAIVAEPRLTDWRDLMREATGVMPTLAGSGATWFVEGEWPAPSADILGDARWIVSRTSPPLPLK